MKRRRLFSLIFLIAGLAIAGAQGKIVLKVKVQKADVLSEMSLSAPVIKELAQGTEVEASRKVGEWYEIETTNDLGVSLTCYIHMSAVVVVSAEPAASNAPAALDYGPEPEQDLLESYFKAVASNDTTTMSEMAFDPIKIEAASWKIVSAGEEKIVPAALPDLRAKELDLKEQVEQHVGLTLDSKDALDAAKDEYSAARSGAAKAAAKAKLDAAQAKYDEEYKFHMDLQRQYDEAKADAAKEEKIKSLSVGTEPLPNKVSNNLELKGHVHSKVVEVDVTLRDGTTKKLNVTIEMYSLTDEAAGISFGGRWVITKFETL